MIKTARLLLLILGALHHVLKAEDGEPELKGMAGEKYKSFKILYQQKVDIPTSRRINDLRKSYTVALKRELAKSSSSGNLNDSLAIKDEIEVIEKSLDPSATQSNSLVITTLRQIWVREMAKIDAEKLTLTSSLKVSFDRDLGDLESNLTKAGRIDEATAVHSLRNTIQGYGNTAISAQSANGKNLIDDMHWSGVVPIEMEDESFILSSRPDEHPRFETKDSFTPPFKILMRFVPLTHETRLHYGFGQIIFGWENDPEQIRVHSPLSFNPPHPMKTAPKPGKECRVELTIQLSKLILKVNDVMVYKENGNFSELNSPISVGACSGNKTKLIELLHIPLDKKVDND